MKKVKNSCLLIKELLCPNVSQYYQDILRKKIVIIPQYKMFCGYPSLTD